eukprot:TRINITY_DN17747_c0_g1_i2.p1 TRINITY_DN17747_c0_g1~~TRINITY_DN17747_c0_g1_i2.p1  ORF type:complete len:209 (+),score=34.03 TRINITY_DN17747_c0_g1_i2:500-1126(+)
MRLFTSDLLDRSSEPESEARAYRALYRNSAGEEQEVDDASPSPLTRWFTASSGFTGWSFAGPAADDSDRVDLSGNWVLDRIDGPMEELMADAGVPWAIRKMARAGNYGVGLLGQNIVQNGDDIIIEFKHFQTITCKFRVGVAECETLGEENLAQVITGRWEGSSLWIEGVFKGGAALQKNRRYLEDGEMVQETHALAGFSVKRIFRRA